jgi:hypothetical protein
MTRTNLVARADARATAARIKCRVAHIAQEASVEGREYNAIVKLWLHNRRARNARCARPAAIRNNASEAARKYAAVARNSMRAAYHHMTARIEEEQLCRTNRIYSI